MSCLETVHPFHQFDLLVWIAFKNIGHPQMKNLAENVPQ